MRASTRAVLTSGVAALSVGAVAVAVSAPPASMRTIEVLRPLNFAADILPIAPDAPVETPSDDDLDAALALIEQLAPVTDGRMVTVTLSGDEHPGTVTVAPKVPNAAAKADAALAGGGSDDISDQGTLDEPVALNTASDLIDNVYSISRYWANYVSLELFPWLVNWVPFGYLISDQINIWYPDFVLPTVDSFVYDFLDPVVNDPLNLAVWVDGIGDIINAAASGAVEGLRNEINYIVTFGWFPIPLPPFPPFPGVTSESTPAAVALTSIEVDETATDGTNGDGTVANGIGKAANEPADSDTTDAATEAPSQEGTEEEKVGDGTEAPAEAQPEEPGTPADAADESGTPADAADESAERSSDESPADTNDEARGAVDGTVNDESGSADETGDVDVLGDADETGDADALGDADETGDADALGDADLSGDADQSADVDADKGTAQDTGSGSGETSSDGDGDGVDVAATDV